MLMRWGKAPPCPPDPALCRAIHVPLKPRAAYASWMMPTSLLAALPADAVINHQVTGWQCPSLTWGWLRRVCFLPAWQRAALRGAGLLAGGVLLRNLRKAPRFQQHSPCRNVTNCFANQQDGGLREWANSIILQHSHSPTPCCVAVRHQATAEVAWYSRGFF